MEQIQESSFELSISRVTQSIDLDDTVAVEDANIVVESSLLLLMMELLLLGKEKNYILTYIMYMHKY